MDSRIRPCLYWKQSIPSIAWGLSPRVKAVYSRNNLGGLYKDQGKLAEAEKMYQRALDGKEKALSPTHTSTLGTVINLGLLYKDQGKLDEAEKIYQRFPNAKANINDSNQCPGGETIDLLRSLEYKRLSVKRLRPWLSTKFKLKPKISHGPRLERWVVHIYS